MRLFVVAACPEVTPYRRGEAGRFWCYDRLSFVQSTFVRSPIGSFVGNYTKTDARCRTLRATSAPGAPTLERERQRFSRHPLLRRPKGALCSKPPNGPPDFPAASKFLPTPHHNPLRGGRKIRRPIVTSPSRLHRAHAAALGIVAAAEELLVGRSGGPQDHRRATTGACGRIGFGDGLM